MSEGYEIPAANISRADLDAVARRFPDTAKEISRLVGLMDIGEETKEEFRRLCELLHEVGETKEAEYLLRRNLEYYEGAEMYERLFGTAIRDDFSKAIERFAEEFGQNLIEQRKRDFLDKEYLSIPLSGEYPRFNILDASCLIRFEYSRKDCVVADIVAAEGKSNSYFNLSECIFMRWQENRWRLIDPRDAQS